MWSYRYLSRIDFRIIPLLAGLLFSGLLAISAYSTDGSVDAIEGTFFTSAVIKQIKGIGLGIAVFIFFAGFDYNKLREWTWILYALMVLALLGLFFVPAIQNVHRWYRLPLIGMNFQPSEYAKLIVVIALSWFLERNRAHARSLKTAFYALLIVGIPFLLILKQPDLGTALVLFPTVLVMFYFGDLSPWVIKSMAAMGAAVLIVSSLMFLSILPHEELRPYETTVLKNYQYDRLNPNTHHQKAATSAIAVGGVLGKGWRKSDYTAGGWLPEPYTDSVFPAFGEEFGFVGLLIILAMLYALIHFNFQVAVATNDHFARLLAAGVTTSLAMQGLVNIGMMTGFLPITGVPLILVSFGGSSILSTMTALGILQSIYSRRFMF